MQRMRRTTFGRRRQASSFMQGIIAARLLSAVLKTSLCTVFSATMTDTGQPLQRSLSRSGQDRKSTRLNSSHVAISYAVFCLKKKKIHDKEEDLRRLETV